MRVKYFVEAREKEDAIRLVYDSLQDMKDIILNQERINVALYWKMEHTYIVECKIDLYKDALQSFLDIYSDAWIEFGCPVEEYLASCSNVECKYMKEKFKLINVFL